MRDDLSGLTTLLTVAEKRSFTAAAAELRLTPSAVSQSVRALEERLGVRLLQRTTRSVGLTEAGTRFIARLKPALDDVHEAYESLGELRDKPAGTLRLNLPRMGYELILAPKLAAFLDAYPEIDFDIVIEDAFVDIVKEGFDAGIRIGESVEEQLTADLEAEREAMARLRPAITLTMEAGDTVTRLLLEQILKSEEEHVDYLETQLNLYRTLGEVDYLAQQIDP